MNKSLDDAQIFLNRLAVAEDSAVSCTSCSGTENSLQLNVLVWCLE